MNTPLVAVDIGNSRLKLGLFDAAAAGPLPEPSRVLAIRHDWPEADLIEWLAKPARTMNWCVASVHRPGSKRLVGWLNTQGVSNVRLLTAADLQLKVAVPEPERVGIDRLADCLAANHLRRPKTPAIVADFGSAITLNLVDAEGTFVGGTIMPGIDIAAAALHELTDLLPKVEVIVPPEPLGTSTIESMRSGLFWGAVGGVRELAARLVSGPCDRFITGGAASAIVRVLCGETDSGWKDGAWKFVPHLTLSGIALAASEKS